MCIVYKAIDYSCIVPTMPTSSNARIRLAGRAELAKMLHVSRSRAVQLSEKPGFPEPLDVITMGNVWALDDVIGWAVSQGRTLDLGALSLVVDARTEDNRDAKTSPIA